MNLVDSCGWLEYFANDSNADFFAPPIEDVGNLIVPSLCIFEVFRNILRQKNKELAFQAIALMRQGNIIDLDTSIALEAAQLSLKHKLPLADSLILATANINNAVIWTQDADFKDIKDVKYIKKKGS